MTRKILVALLLGTGLLAAAQQCHALDPGEDTLDITQNRHFYKDPVTAFRMAFFPGFLVHGRGTIYAGRRTEGAVLLAGEAISGVLMLVGLWEKERPESFQKFPGNNDSLAVAESSGRRMLTYGIIGFAATWAVDMAYAPHAAARYNAAHRLSPALEWDAEGMRLGLSASF